MPVKTIALIFIVGYYTYCRNSGKSKGLMTVIKDLFFKDGQFSAQPTEGAKAVAIRLPKHYTLSYDGCGNRHLRYGHGEIMQILTYNDYGRPVPEMIDRWGNRQLLELAA